MLSSNWIKLFLVIALFWLIATTVATPMLAAGPTVPLPNECTGTGHPAPQQRPAPGAAAGSTTSWTANVLVNDDGGSTTQWAPSLAVDAAGVLYAAWEDERQGNADIFFARSTDRGQTWSANRRVDNDSSAASQRSPSLAAGGSGQLYLAWEDQRNGNADIFFARSTDGGQTWGPNLRVNNDSGAAAQDSPTLAVSIAGVLHLAWRDARQGQNDIYAAYSTNGGASWSANLRIDDDSGVANQSQPSLATMGSVRVFIAWRDERRGQGDIFVARSTNAGQSWSANQRLNDDSGVADQARPRLAVMTPASVYAVWQDGRAGVRGVFFGRSTDGGQSWGQNLPLAVQPGAVNEQPVLTVSGQGVLSCFWCLAAPPDAGDIVAAQSHDGGMTWGAPMHVSDDASGALQDQPSAVTAPDGLLHVLWRDERRGHADIFAAASQLDRFLGLIIRLWQPGRPTPAPTPTPTGTFTPTPTRTPTGTFTPTPTRTPTGTFTPTRTPTGTFTPTPTRTPTPIVVILNAVADAYINSALPTANFGAASTLIVGSQTANQVSRSLFGFALGAIPTGATIVNAEFRVAQLSASTTPPILQIELKRIDGPWQEFSVAWNTQPAYTGAGNVKSVPSAPGMVAWNVTSLVQWWAAGNPHNGLALNSVTEGTVGWRGFASREASPPPQLMVVYRP